MNKIASKKVIAIVAVLALVAILGVCLVACNSDTVGKSLEKKGYHVTVLNEKSTGTIAKAAYNVVKNNSDFKEGVVASKDADVVTVLWFETTEAAEQVEGNILFSAFTVERSGKIVYIGTAQGVADAK